LAGLQIDELDDVLCVVDSSISEEIDLSLETILPLLGKDIAKRIVDVGTAT